MRQETTLKDYPIPQSDGLEIQIIADLLVLPETIVQAEQLINEDMFDFPDAQDAWRVIKTMAKEGKVID
ncbi:MAG: hypothetical protein J6U51_00300, partial [Bacteroidales bacterium]|nr:hypothetical protein [Bacteroidales bacterium]